MLFDKQTNVAKRWNELSRLNYCQISACNRIIQSLLFIIIEAEIKVKPCSSLLLEVVHKYTHISEKWRYTVEYCSELLGLISFMPDAEAVASAAAAADDDDIWYDKWFALENWQASCHLDEARKLKELKLF